MAQMEQVLQGILKSISRFLTLQRLLFEFLPQLHPHLAQQVLADPLTIPEGGTPERA